MIVCSCLRVTEREVRAAIRQGAETVAEIGEACAAGTRCGTCQPSLCALLQQRQDGASSSAPFRWLRTPPARPGVPRAG